MSAAQGASPWRRLGARGGAGGPGGRRHPVSRLIDVLVVGLVGAVLLAVAAAPAGSLLGIRLASVVGEAMAPTLPSGSAVIVRTVSHDAVTPGDLILIGVATPDPVVRRVVEVRSLGTTAIDVYFQVQADGADGPESRLVRARDVLGRVDGAIPLLGHLLAATASQLGTWTLLSALGSLLTLRLVVDEITARRPSDPERGPVRRARIAR
jgi:hypothetical protein